MAKSCIRWLKCIFIACVPIFGWIGFVYHIAFAFVMTVVSHNISEFFVVVAPVLDVYSIYWRYGYTHANRE